MEVLDSPFMLVRLNCSELDNPQAFSTRGQPSTAHRCHRAWRVGATRWRW